MRWRDSTSPIAAPRLSGRLSKEHDEAPIAEGCPATRPRRRRPTPRRGPAQEKHALWVRSTARQEEYRLGAYEIFGVRAAARRKVRSRLRLQAVRVKQSLDGPNWSPPTPCTVRPSRLPLSFDGPRRADFRGLGDRIRSSWRALDLHPRVLLANDVAPCYARLDTVAEPR